MITLEQSELSVQSLIPELVRLTSSPTSTSREGKDIRNASSSSHPTVLFIIAVYGFGLSSHRKCLLYFDLALTDCLNVIRFRSDVHITLNYLLY